MRRALAALLAGACLPLAACSSIVTLEMPSVEPEAASPLTRESVVVGPDGARLAVLRREHRQPITLADVPPHVLDAVLTAEDRRFFDHRGVDARAIARAAVDNVTSGEVRQGGSTITQQLVKNRYLPPSERTADTKLVEALLARDLERTRSKGSILEEYLNTVYLGEGAYGLQAAAQTYFRRDVVDLDVAQAATLAAVIRAPSSLGPAGDREVVRRRRDDVLHRMADDGLLRPLERDVALATPIEVHGRAPLPDVVEPHLVDHVVRTLLADPSFGPSEQARADRLYGGGLTVHTTIDPQLQADAREALARHLPDAEDPEAAITVVDPATGHVLAAVGNRPYDELQFDLPTQARRQPGSTFKTFVLAAAIADGRHPDELLDGRPGMVDTGEVHWEVANYDDASPERVSLAGATRTSVNAAYARLGVEVGVPRVAALARAMGVASPVPNDPQITLGGGTLGVTTLDLASAYATLADGGRHRPATVVDRVEDADGTVVWGPPGTAEPVLTPDVAYVTTQVLQGVVEGGTGLAAKVPGWPVAGKTGTTSDHADAWFAGTTPTLSAAVWVGHVEGRVPMQDVQGIRAVTGGTLPARIFADVVTGALEDVEPVEFTLEDAGWTTVSVDPRTGLLAEDGCPGERVRLPRVLAPTRTCSAATTSIPVSGDAGPRG